MKRGIIHHHGIRLWCWNNGFWYHVQMIQRIKEKQKEAADLLNSNEFNNKNGNFHPTDNR